jgi:hypothetical protein
MRRLSRRTCDGCTARRPSTDNAVAILAYQARRKVLLVGAVGRRVSRYRLPRTCHGPNGVAACRKSSHCLS